MIDANSVPAKRTPFTVQPIPVQRVLDRLDVLLSQRDYVNAEQQLLFWLSEAKNGNDLSGQLTLSNELIGYYRKQGNESEALRYVDDAVNLIQTMNLEGSITAGTSFINAATAYNAFGQLEKSREFFEKASIIYESSPAVTPFQMGGLYNNMGLNCAALGLYEEAMELYQRALNQMERVTNGSLEQAVTLLNMADAVAAKEGTLAGENQIGKLIQSAYAHIRDESVLHDSYYAFVCEKCIPSFSYYGFFAIASELQEEVRRIHEGA
ncbi:MAG: tetratricopeptide repeat protein [Oscillospiraceae bacterium]|nr:tetratricopeptide repeat protein [Oscillospiraceae bacterium]